MLWLVMVLLLLLWALGIVSGYTFGSFINVALVLALATLAIALIRRDVGEPPHRGRDQHPA